MRWGGSMLIRKDKQTEEDEVPIQLREWRMGRHSRPNGQQEQRLRPGETAWAVVEVNPLWTRKPRQFSGEKEHCFQQMVLGQLDIHM